jgi:hypothetical protein
MYQYNEPTHLPFLLFFPHIAIPYSWKRGRLAEPSGSLDVPAVKKRGPTISLWKTGIYMYI